MSSDALNSEWFFPKMTRADAEKCLEAPSTPPGAFVVRPSSQRDCLALSHKNHDGSIGHALIYSTNNGFVLERTQLHLPTVLAVLQTLPLSFNAPVQTHLLSAAAINRLQASQQQQPNFVPTAASIAADRDMPWSDSSPTTSSTNLLSHSGDSASSSLASSPVRAAPSGLSIQFDALAAAADEHSEDGAESAPDADSPDLEPEISSPRQPQRSTLRAAFQLRKRATNNTPGGGGGGGDAAANSGSDDDNQPLSARRQRGSAGVTATLRSARNSEAPIDEEYVLKLLATPDLLNPAKMTADENRLFERLVVQLQLQLKALAGLPTPSAPTTPRSGTLTLAVVEQTAQH